MKRIVLLFLGVIALTACNKDDNSFPEEKIYLVDKITETLLPIGGGTQTETTERNYWYAPSGIVVKYSEKLTRGTATSTETVYEIQYEGSTPKQTTVTKGGVVSKISYVFENGRIKQKTETQGASTTPTVTDLYEYGNNRLVKHTHTSQQVPNSVDYIVTEYSHNPNQIETKTSKYTEVNGAKGTVYTETDVYELNYHNTVSKHTHTSGILSYTKTYLYDGKINPLYLNVFHRLTSPELSLTPEYMRYNITKVTEEHPNMGGYNYQEETTYSYSKHNYPLTASTKRDGKEVKKKEFAY